jgi:hypothetical protein
VADLGEEEGRVGVVRAEGRRELEGLWQERDRELGRMEQLFECLRERLSEYHEV